MDLEYTEEQKMMKKVARDFMKKELIPVADEYEKRGYPLSKEEATGFIKKLIPLGYIVSLVPEKYGGLGRGYMAHGILLEELAYAWASMSGVVHISSIVLLELISGRATDEHRAKYLAPLMSGDIISAGAITEPDVGSSGPRGLKTKVVLDGDHYVINGVKVLSARVENLDAKGLRNFADVLKGKLHSGIVVLGLETDGGRISLISAVTKDLTSVYHAAR